MKKKKIIASIIITVLLALFLVYGVTKLMENNITRDKLKELNYNEKTINLIIKHNIHDYILENNLSSNTLQVALLENKFKIENLELYSNFEYREDKNFINNLNKLNNLGYTIEEINILFNYLKPEEVSIIANKEKKKSNLTKFCTSKQFDINNYDRYVLYKEKNPDYDYETVVNYVNINLDYEFYENIKDALFKHTELVLINKYYKVDENYIPKNLEPLDISCAVNFNIPAVLDAKEAFELLCADAKSIGLTIKAISGYRSYASQRLIYDRYLENDPIEIVDTYSARPGHSEHQSGYALDLYNEVVPYTRFGETDEYEWLKNNAHNYGFIIRYQKGKEYITGYKYEPWHIRYVGINVASYIFENNITLEEYIDKYKKGAIK